MAVIHPFRALRPHAEHAQQVASLPYDVVSTEEARALAQNNPLSFLHVSRAEIDLPLGTDIYSDDVYTKATGNFWHLVETCPFVMDETPSIYIYRLQMGAHVQTGIAACCAVDEYDADRIRKHERTRPDKEDDRTRHILALQAQTGPVLLTYRPDLRIDTLVHGATNAAAPLYDFTADNGIRHTLWRADADATAPLVHAFREIELLYIADGHHRAASASRARAAINQQEGQHDAGQQVGTEEYNRFLAVLFPADQMQIFSYNRIVRDLNTHTPAEFLHIINERFIVQETTGTTPAGMPRARGEWCMYTGGKRWYSLMLRAENTLPSDPVARLDVSLLQDFLLDPVLGIKDVRRDKRIDFVGGVRGITELERLVDGGHAAVAFSLYPTTIDDLLEVSDANQIMPPKSTWFEPKLRDGLLIHTIESR